MDVLRCPDISIYHEPIKYLDYTKHINAFYKLRILNYFGAKNTKKQTHPTRFARDVMFLLRFLKDNLVIN